MQSLNSKQRQLRKSGNELLPNDAAELQRVSTEQQALQKHLEAARKQARQHSMLIQVTNCLFDTVQFIVWFAITDYFNFFRNMRRNSDSKIPSSLSNL